MKTFLQWIAPILVLLVIATPVPAQVSLVGTTYSEDFNMFLGSELTVPAGWIVSSSGIFTYKGTNAGTTATGGVYAFGSSPDYSLGALRTDTTGNITFNVNFSNDTGQTITAIQLIWDYEQYRYVNTSGFSVAGTGVLSGNSTIAANGLVGSNTGTNGVATTTAISITLSGLSISNGDTFGLIWTTTDGSGGDNNIAIDNFNLSVTAVPEPSTYAAILGGVALGGVMVLRRRKSAANAA